MSTTIQHDTRAPEWCRHCDGRIPISRGCFVEHKTRRGGRCEGSHAYAVMDIYAAPGSRVALVFGRSGYQSDQETAKRYLQAGGIYTVERVEVGGSSSLVFLREVPGVGFNTVLFADWHS